MSNYGQRGRELLLELKSSDWLPPYNDEAVRATLQEIQLHFDELTDQIIISPAGEKPAMEMRPSLLLHDAAIRRNKRCLLAYHVYRLKKLRESYYCTAGNDKLSEAEVDFMTDYEKLRARYYSTSSTSSSLLLLDLQANTFPPCHDLVQVRVLKDNLGKLVQDMGTCVSLEMGTLHYLPRTDVEPLIRQGFLEQVDGEEGF
jgi:GINS complex subunit 1